MRRIRRSRASSEDIDGIWDYVAEGDIRAADALIETFEAKLRSLADNPMLGPARPELAPNLRSFGIRNYVILHEPRPDGIFLVRVLHGARDVRRLF